MVDDIEPITPPETRGSGTRRRRRVAAVVTVAALLAAGLVWGAFVVLGSCGSVGSQVKDIDGACVGVTSGEYVFHPDLADVQEKIAEENERVRADPRGYVSIVLLDPLTAGENGALPPAAVRNRLEGAYTALRRLNEGPVAGDPNPQIQLLLANQGTTDAQWSHVRERLLELSSADRNPLVAVVGLGVSDRTTLHHATDLSGLGIPMVGAVLTADSLEYDQVPGLIKTSPSNRHYVAALRDHLADIGVTSAIMVRDSNSDNGTDLYTQTLETQFAAQMGDLMDFETQQFTGRSQVNDTPPSLFDNVQANICLAAGNKSVAVLYAGREIDFGDLLNSLANRTCRSAELTILTAGLELGEVLRGRNLHGAGITVLNAATVDPQGWAEGAPGTPEGYADFRAAFTERYPESHLDGGGAIMMHDAVLTASRAIRLAAPQGAASRITTGSVRTQLLNINTLYKVRGANGTLSFSKNPTGVGTGTPTGKPIPVLRYPHSEDPDRFSQQVGTLCRVSDGPDPVNCG